MGVNRCLDRSMLELENKFVSCLKLAMYMFRGGVIHFKGCKNKSDHTECLETSCLNNIIPIEVQLHCLIYKLLLYISITNVNEIKRPFTISYERIQEPEVCSGLLCTFQALIYTNVCIGLYIDTRI